jgi:hypothetical protein
LNITYAQSVAIMQRIPSTIDMPDHWGLAQTSRVVGYADFSRRMKSVMGKLAPLEELFPGRHFDRDFIILLQGVAPRRRASDG